VDVLQFQRLRIHNPFFAVLGDGFATEAVGEVSLKGKAHTVGVYRVTGRAAPSVGEDAASETHR